MLKCEFPGRFQEDARLDKNFFGQCAQLNNNDIIHALLMHTLCFLDVSDNIRFTSRLSPEHICHVTDGELRYQEKFQMFWKTPNLTIWA